MFLTTLEMKRWNNTETPKIEAGYRHGRNDLTIELNTEETEKVAAICAEAVIRTLNAPLVAPMED